MEIMKNRTRIIALAGLLGLTLVMSAGCQTFGGAEGPAIATVINQTIHDLEVQEQGEFVTVLGRGDTYNVRGPTGRAPVRSVTLVVLAYDEQGEYVGSAFRTLRQRGFTVWEISNRTLRRPEDEMD